MAYPEYCRSASDALAYDQGFRLVPALAEAVRDWMAQHLRHSIGQWAGQPFELLPWQYQDIVLPLFGWIDPASGLRRFRRALVWVTVKQGKTTLGAAIGLRLMFEEPAAHVFSAAYDKEMASLAHSEAIRMVDQSPDLSAVTNINRTVKTIQVPQTQSLYRTISHDANRIQGLNASGLIVDEIHTFRGFEFWEVLEQRTRARRQPLTFCISTAGIFEPEGFGWLMYRRCHDILDGVITDIRTLPVIYEAPQDLENIEDPAAIRAANPSIDVTVRLDTLLEAAREARGNPRATSAFKRYNLNIWVQSAETWLDLDAWDACALEVANDVPLDDELTYYGGLDLASVDDMASLCLVARLPDDRIGCWHWFWAPEKGAHKREAQGLPLMSWAAQGLVDLHPGGIIDLNRIQDFILELRDDIDLREMAFDPYQALQMATTLRDTWGLSMVQCPQSCRHYNEPARHLEALIANQQLAHQGHPVCRWNVANATLKEDAAGHIMPQKPSPDKKIDGLACLLMALGRMLFSSTAEVSISL